MVIWQTYMYIHIPAALLAEAALLAGDDDLGGFGVGFADSVAAVVVFGGFKVEIAALDLAAWVLHIVIRRS